MLTDHHVLRSDVVVDHVLDGARTAAVHRVRNDLEVGVGTSVLSPQASDELLIARALLTLYATHLVVAPRLLVTCSPRSTILSVLLL